MSVAAAYVVYKRKQRRLARLDAEAAAERAESEKASSDESE